MQVSSTNSTTSSSDPTATPANTLSGSQDEFLKLFMAQLENQDPLNPQSGSDMVAQLAQFSQVEQATETNQHLADLASAQAATSSASLSNLVGRTCNASAGAFQLDHGGAIPAIQVTSPSPMSGASVVITDSNGKELRRLAIPNGASISQLQWDGNDASGTPLAPGSYNISVDPGTSTSSINAQWHGQVSAVELNGSTQLRMGGVLVAPSSIQTIGLDTPIASTPTTSPVTSSTSTSSNPGSTL